MPLHPKFLKYRCCPNGECRFNGRFDAGNLRIHSRVKSKSTGFVARIVECCECGTRFAETRDTIYFRSRLPRRVVERLAIDWRLNRPTSAVARKLGISRNTARRYRDLFEGGKLG